MTNVLTNESTSAKQVALLVRTAVKAYQSAPEKVQQAGIAIISHAEAYGDCSQAKVLARGVPQRLRNGLINWFRMYSPIGVNIDSRDASKDKCGFIRGDRANKFDVEAAKANPWYEDKNNPDPAPKPLNTMVNFYEVIERMLKNQLKKAETDGVFDPQQRPIIHEEAEELLTIVNKHKAKAIAKIHRAEESQTESRKAKSAGNRSEAAPVAA